MTDIMSPATEAAVTRKRRRTAKKAAATRKRSATAKKAVTTRKRRLTARKAVQTKKRNRVRQLVQDALSALESGNSDAAKGLLRAILGDGRSG